MLPRSILGPAWTGRGECVADRLGDKRLDRHVRLQGGRRLASLRQWGIALDPSHAGGAGCAADRLAPSHAAVWRPAAGMMMMVQTLGPCPACSLPHWLLTPCHW